MCNAKHLLTTALNVLKMIKQEGNFSQQALTDGFSNNERPFGAACRWERVGRWLLEDAFGAGRELGASHRCDGLGVGLRPHGSIPRDGVGWWRRCPSPAQGEILAGPRWEQAMGWGWVAALGTPPAGPDPHHPIPSPECGVEESPLVPQ